MMKDTAAIKLISTDFDGTLFAEFENPPVPESLQLLIGSLQAGGARWVINTGRDMSSLMETLGRANLRIEPDFLVLVEREIYRLEDSEYVSLMEWNSACSQAHAQLFARIRQDLPELHRWISSRFHAHLYSDPYSPFCIIAGNNGDMDLIHRHLDEYCRSVPFLTVVRNDVYARFSHADYNKGTALAEITRLLGLERSQVFAAGDHLNDLPMLRKEFAAYLGAPMNAVPEVKESLRAQGGYVSESWHGHGVAEALERYLGGSAAGA
jgi:hydroxymethylpyrimidine pyrophosphatase-like HAD family hydrolase